MSKLRAVHINFLSFSFKENCYIYNINIYNCSRYRFREIFLYIVFIKVYFRNKKKMEKHINLSFSYIYSVCVNAIIYKFK